MTEDPRPSWTAEASGHRLTQPDQRACGATVLVVARMLTDPGYARFAADPATFRAEVLAMHRRVTSLADVRGRAQVPWPRALGTPPWAVAHQLEGTTGIDHDVRLVVAGDRDAAYDEVVAATARRLPVPVFVGNRWLPRHVVLAIGEVGGRLRCYEPAAGRLVDVSRAEFVAGTLDLAGWDVPWVTVPARAAPAGRRTPA